MSTPINYGLLKEGLPQMDISPFLSATLQKQNMGLQAAIAAQNANIARGNQDIQRQGLGLQSQQMQQQANQFDRTTALDQQKIALADDNAKRAQQQQALQNEMQLAQFASEQKQNDIRNALTARSQDSENTYRNAEIGLRTNTLNNNLSQQQQQAEQDAQWQAAVKDGLATKDFSKAMAVDPERTIKLLGSSGTNINTTLDATGKPVTNVSLAGTGISGLNGSMLGGNSGNGATANANGVSSNGKAIITPSQSYDLLNQLSTQLDSMPSEIFGAKNAIPGYTELQVKTGKYGPDIEAFQQMNDNLRKMEMMFNSGSVSDSEQKMYAARKLDLSNPKAVNQAKLNASLAMAERNVALQQFQDTYKELMGPLYTDAGYDAAKKQYVDQNRILNPDFSVNKKNIANWQSYIPVNEQTINAKAQMALRAGADSKKVEALRQQMLQQLGQ